MKERDRGRNSGQLTGDSLSMVGDEYIKEVVERIYSGGKEGGNYTKDIVKDFEKKLID